MSKKTLRTDEEWRSLLTAEQFRVLRRAGTEPAFSGEYADLEDVGIYLCAGCGAELFSSADKFHSGCGWPSFTRPFEAEAVTEHSDHSFGMRRVEVRCARCEGHLGHVFTDGPKPTGLRHQTDSWRGPGMMGFGLMFHPSDARRLLTPADTPQRVCVYWHVLCVTIHSQSAIQPGVACSTAVR